MAGGEGVDGGDEDGDADEDVEEEVAARRRSDEMRDNDKSTNMQKRGAPQRGALIAFIYAYAVIWPQNHSPKKKISA